jgi:integrase/recombinase XerD
MLDGLDRVDSRQAAVHDDGATSRGPPSTSPPRGRRREALDSLNTGKITGKFANFWPFFMLLASQTVISRCNPSALDAIPCSAFRSPEEVARFLEAAPGVKYKAALSVAYGAGLRVSEVVALKVSDVDSKRMQLAWMRVRTGLS